MLRCVARLRHAGPKGDAVIPPGFEVCKDTFAQLDAIPRSSLEIWQRVGQWSQVSIRHALNELVASGLAVRERREYRNSFHYLFHISPGTPGHPLTDESLQRG